MLHLLKCSCSDIFFLQINESRKTIFDKEKRAGRRFSAYTLITSYTNVEFYPNPMSYIKQFFFVNNYTLH